MTIIQTAQLGNEVMRIVVDDDPDNPREWDNLGTMACWHRRYSLGDKHEFETSEEFHEWIKKEKAIVLPLYLYDHSGLCIQTTPFQSHWDSGQVGYIYATYEAIRKEFNCKRVTQKTIEKVKRILRGEVNVYDLYIRGEVFGFRIVELVKCECCGHVEEKPIDSCFGFFGSSFDENGLLDHVDEKWQKAEWKEIR